MLPKRDIDSRLFPDFYACEALISNVEPPAQAGRAERYPKSCSASVSRRTRPRTRESADAQTPREIALLFAPVFPNELLENRGRNPRY